jgi:aminomethyltransferase
MKKTPLFDAHKTLNAKMAPFAGYEMPITYPDGVIKEHEWVRSHAGLFDVSHMGQVTLSGPGAAAFWEKVTPSAFQKAKPGAARYTVMTGEDGGILDDLIVTRLAENEFYAVLNAGRKDSDIAWIKKNLPPGLTFHYREGDALLALQGPLAEKIMRDVFGVDLSDLPYMHGRVQTINGVQAMVSRLGYTGEDGFELGVPASAAATIWDKLLAHPEVRPIGLAARDSLRLEMGYCLYGHDIDAATTPLEADLGWVMRKNGADFIGAPAIVARGMTRRRVGLRLLDKGVAREGATILDEKGEAIGALTSGGFSPTLRQSIGQGYVEQSFARPGQRIQIDVRGRRIPAEICAMPFREPRTKSSRPVEPARESSKIAKTS